MTDGHDPRSNDTGWSRSLQPSHQRALVRLMVGILVVLCGWAARATSTVSMPLAFALFIVVLFSPLDGYLRHYLPRMVAVALTFVAVLASLGSLVAGLWLCAQMVSQHVQASEGGLVELERAIGEAASALGLADPTNNGKLLQALGTVAGDLAKRLADATGGLVLVVTFAMLAISEREAWRRKLCHKVGPSGLQTATDISARCRSYLVTRTFTSALTGLLTGLLTWAVGLDLAYVWGITAFLLNYVPTLGGIIAIIPPTLLAVVQLGAVAGFGVFVGLTLIQLALGSYLDPKLQGKTLQLSPFVLLFSIGFWAYIWGVGGALLAVPLTMAVAVVCDQFPRSRWIAELLAEDIDAAVRSGGSADADVGRRGEDGDFEDPARAAAATCRRPASETDGTPPARSQGTARERAPRT